MSSTVTPVTRINEDWMVLGSRLIAIGNGRFDDHPLCFTPIEYAAFPSGYWQPNVDFFGQCPPFADYPTYGSVSPNYSVFTRLQLSTVQSATAPTTPADGLDAAPAILDEILPELTPLSGVGAANALRRAWKRATAQTPSQELLVILTAHWAHETAAGTCMFNHNFGGIKGRGPTGLSCLRGAREGFGWRAKAIRDRFRAYPNASSGADDYLSLLLRKYPTAIEAAELGDASAFVRALHEGKYFTGIRNDYEQSVIKYSVRAKLWVHEAIGFVRSPQTPSPTAVVDTPEPLTATQVPSELAVTVRAPVATEAP